MIDLTVTSNVNIPSWKTWFDTRPSTKYINDNAKARLFSTFDYSVEKDACMRALLEHDETVFLFKQNMAGNKLNIIHHLKRIGGNIYDPEEQFGAIQGVGDDTSCIITPDVNALLVMPMAQGEPVPSIANIYGAKTEEDITNLPLSIIMKYHPRNFVPVPPFLIGPIDTVIEQSNGDGTKILLRVIKAINDFDDVVNDTGPQPLEDTKTSCVDIVFWLFLN